MQKYVNLLKRCYFLYKKGKCFLIFLQYHRKCIIILYYIKVFFFLPEDQNKEIRYLTDQIFRYVIIVYTYYMLCTYYVFVLT